MSLEPTEPCVHEPSFSNTSIVSLRQQSSAQTPPRHANQTLQCAERLQKGVDTASHIVCTHSETGIVENRTVLLQGVHAAGALAHELCMHLRCAGPNTVSILSVGMDKIPRGPVLSANVICFSMELASMSLKTYIA